MGALNGKVAWVTGAGSGIGAAAAAALAGAGARVFLTGRRMDALQGVADGIDAAGGQVSVLPGDLSLPGVAAGIAGAIEREAGRLDIVVNNAGTNIPRRSWQELDEAGAEEVLDGNLKLAFHTVIAALPIMRRQRQGLIITTGSIAGRHVGAISGSSYTAAKHGVVAMSHSINLEEMHNGIRATVICPGEVATPIIDKRPAPADAEGRRRMLRPSDLADLVLHVATLPAHVCVSELVVIPTGAVAEPEGA